MSATAVSAPAQANWAHGVPDDILLSLANVESAYGPI